MTADAAGLRASSRAGITTDTRVLDGGSEPGGRVGTRQRSAMPASRPEATSTRLDTLMPRSLSLGAA